MGVPINRFEYLLTRVMALLDRPWKIVITFDLAVLALALTIMVLTGTVSAPILLLILALSTGIGYFIARILSTYNKINRGTLEELKRVARELAMRNADLETFALTVAHDLKTPISSIYGYTYLLSGQEEQDPDVTRDAAVQIQQSAEKMSRIVDDLLTLAQIGTSDVDSKPIEMKKVVANSLQRLAPAIEKAHAEVQYDSDWPTAWGHAAWVEEVWVNYISNAIKYGGTPPKIILGSSLEDGGANFWVTDNGNGIRPEEQEQLFNEFFRLDHSRAEGHGLGLAIVRRIVGKLNGEVGVESRPGEGSTFYFTLPTGKR